MTPTQIKAYMMLKGYHSVTAFALALNEKREAVSQVINYSRPNARIRRKIERKLKITLAPFPRQQPKRALRKAA